MGMFLNPDNSAFQIALNSRIYVDKTGLISHTNSVMDTDSRLICSSRPRRFGKSMAADMLTAYYSRGCDSEKLFSELGIGHDQQFKEHLNKYDVIHIDVQWFRVCAETAMGAVSLIKQEVLRELTEAYPEYVNSQDTSLPMVLARINMRTKRKFIIIIDEWDSLIRDDAYDTDAQNDYINLLRGLFKGSQPSSFLKLAYITGILPIIKYDTESALNNFMEVTMLDATPLAKYVGFTEPEVQILCDEYNCDFEEVKIWYDGYCFGGTHVYNPTAIVSAVPTGNFKSYWSKTGTYESLLKYIKRNDDGLRDALILMLSGGSYSVNPNSFQNDLTKVNSRDDVLTVLIHLGYLAYEGKSQTVSIPNEEIREQFVLATQNTDWEPLTRLYAESDDLLQNTWNMNSEAVAKGMELVHEDNTSIFAYNDENALSSVVSLAYLSARQFYYKPIRELPTGKGRADLIFIPRQEHKDKPALVIELKWNKSADSALSQIKERRYARALEAYTGEILLVGINYDVENKVHQCIIEKFMKE